MASSSNAAQNQTQPESFFDQLIPSSASAFASASASNKPPYDIFINHRGCDVKHTLARNIYNTFQPMGLRIFLDIEALEAGDVIPAELQHTITTASLHIAILSPNYAQSPWCLAELSFMLKTSTKIIPIFYKVDPSDFRWIDQGKGIYAHAFSVHEMKGRYTQEKLDDWRKALSIISIHTGYIVMNNEDEMRERKNIVNRVLSVLERVPLHVAKHPVGLDELVNDFEETTLKSAQSHQNVKIVGIVGMGGSGKTTLSKELFNRNFSSFDRSSFVSEVRAEKNALQNKQKELLDDLRLIDDSSLHSVEKGKGILSNRLRSVCALIVLDDVDHMDQLEALLPNPSSLSSNSLVIVTSRDLSVLTTSGISCNYRMRGMDPSHAEQLFSWHAFLRPSPPPEFKSVVGKFLEACNCLPLSLKVIGAQLYGEKSEDVWESLLSKILRILPEDIKQRLQVSYDVLDKEEREIFLDVACFLIGEEKSLAIAVWDGSGWSGLHSLELLVNKCLVELDENNCIRMHDHLRDMGREIAAKHSPARLWLPEHLINMKDFQAIAPIRGISGGYSRNTGLQNCLKQLVGNSRGWHRNKTGLQNCLKQLVGNSRRGFKRHISSLEIKILHMYYNEFTEELASLSEELVWLRCSSFTESKLPSWLSLRNISVLELCDAYNLEELWDDNVQPPLKLRELRIGTWKGNGRLERFPCSIGRLKNLQKIILKNSFVGSSLPEEFCDLQSLEHLALPHSEMLSSLPARFGDLTKLRHIDLSWCYQMQMLPDSFKQLILLEYLNLECCEKLRLRLDMLENVTKLEYLGLSGCVALEELPHQITNQGSLKRLKLYDCFQLRYLPTDIGQMCRLETLTIDYCSMTSLPSSLGQMCRLETLTIRFCRKLTSLPSSLGQMCRLETLTISSCPMLTSLPSSVGDLSSLTTFKIRCCENLTSLILPSPSDKRNFTSLKKFILKGCPKIEKIEGLEHCRSLKELVVVEPSWEVTGIQSLQNMERLDVLKLSSATISALKPCIQSLKEFPLKMKLHGRAVHVVKPIVNSLEFPGLTVMKLCSDLQWRIKEQNKVSFLCYAEKEENNGEGKVVHIAVFLTDRRTVGSFYYENAIVMYGEEVRVVEAFNKFLALL